MGMKRSTCRWWESTSCATGSSWGRRCSIRTRRRCCGSSRARGRRARGESGELARGDGSQAHSEHSYGVPGRRSRGGSETGGDVKQRMAASKLAPEAYGAVADLDRRVAESGIDEVLYLLIKMRASHINRCALCIIDLHTREARKRGEAEERIYALNAWRESPLFSDEERAALGLTEAVTLLSETRVPDDVWAEAEGAFGERELANLLMATVAINA